MIYPLCSGLHFIPGGVRSRIRFEGDWEYGFLLFAIFALFSADRDARLPAALPAAISGQLGPAVGRYFARVICPAHFDIDLHLPKSGLQQYMVCRPPDRDDPCLFWRRT